MNIIELKDMIAAGYIKVNQHPTEDLFIYNYSETAQFERIWNDITLQCRGLILDGQGRVVARPFPKFFNLEELVNKPIPNLPFEVYEKMDGSLGISYSLDGQIFIATRGSFISEQSAKANELLNTKYITAKAQMNPAITYLFEIIYPENRIVLDYGEKEALVLLGMVETATGKELPLADIGFPIVKKYDGLTDIQALKALAFDNKEGFVIRFSNNYRIKVKFEEYVRIHRIIQQVSSVTIWQNLMAKQSFTEILERVPDEFYTWVKVTKAKLEADYLVIENIAKSEYQELATRKETALYFQTCQYPKILFSMLDGKDYSETIWRYIRPTYTRPFISTG
ncbi:MAG: T4 RnlA family RNA ligase [Saprospiraceae bacterium]